MSKPDPDAVRATFESVAHRYDFANHFLSGGIDFYYNFRLIESSEAKLGSRMYTAIDADFEFLKFK